MSCPTCVTAKPIWSPGAGVGFANAPSRSLPRVGPGRSANGLTGPSTLRYVRPVSGEREVRPLSGLASSTRFRRLVSGVRLDNAASRR